VTTIKSKYSRSSIQACPTMFSYPFHNHDMFESELKAKLLEIMALYFCIQINTTYSVKQFKCCY